ncbi:MAG: hypothetical protein U5R14_14120 [Gemmatimonadota bacterium]|nr:hypothetical protein [Gemmatimonadota bacterium]
MQHPKRPTSAGGGGHAARRGRILAWVTLAAAFTGAATDTSAQEEAVALVVRVQGAVQVERGDDSGPAAVGLRLIEGDELRPEDGGRAILVTPSGAQQVVTEATTVRAPAVTEPTDLFTRAVATLAQAASVDATLGGRQGMIRPIPGRTSLVAPRNDLLVSSTRPTFRWTATPDARYDLMLRRADGGRPEIFEVGTDTVWSLPRELDALREGDTYAWTVFVGGRDGGRPLPQQEFRVLDAERRGELESRLDAVRALDLDPTAEGLALSAIIYHDFELFYDATAALRELREAGAPLSPNLHRLEGEAWAELGDAEAARAAFDRATGGAH